MDLFILIIVLAIFAETTILVARKYRKISSGRRKIYVDTSALIDGRILSVARSGFLDGDLLILRSVLRELQLLADGKDSEKRNRARYGLEIAAELERVVNVNTEIVEDTSGLNKVDEALLKLAKENRAAIFTIDYNLIKVAQVEKVQTLNMNELSLAIRSEFIPGEKIEIKITDKGSNPGQGVGHLPDGTMVVVDNAESKIGQEVRVEFMRFLEMPSGKMIFARLHRKRGFNPGKFRNR